MGYVTLIGTIEEFIPIYLQSLGLTALLFGGCLTLIMLAQTVGGFLCQRIGMKDEGTLYLVAAVSCLALASVRFFGAVGSIVLLTIVFTIIGIIEIKLNARLNSAIEGQRATVLSLQSLLVNVAPIILSLAIP